MITYEQFKKTEKKIVKTYRWGHFRIDVGESQCQGIPTWEAWIYHPDYGIKMSMFGYAKEDMNEEDFLRVVYGNAMFYAYDYREEYMDMDDRWDEAEEDVCEETERREEKEI